MRNAHLVFSSVRHDDESVLDFTPIACLAAYNQLPVIVLFYTYFIMYNNIFNRIRQQALPI